MITITKELTGLDLRTFRARERISQERAGEMFGVSQRAISAWENGATPKDFQTRFTYVLAVYYGLPLTGEPDAEPQGAH